MEYKQREYPMFSACGLNCGLCPRYQTDAVSKCPGCSGKDFLAKHPSCGLLSCCQRKGIDYCFECGEYPCPKYDGADSADSFITHLHQLKDMEKARLGGMTEYKNVLDAKIAMLENLLKNYNDGRKKSFYCLAVNLLDLQDVRVVMKALENEVKPEMTEKEKAAIAAKLFQGMADERGTSLKLRKKASQK